MFEIGQIFNKNDSIYCLLDLINYNEKEYAFFSVEKDNKIFYMFFEILDLGDKYDLVEVKDEQITFTLLEKLEAKGYES